jgi:hypothetical protein
VTSGSARYTEVVKGNIQLEPTATTVDGFKTAAELKAAQLVVREHNMLVTEQYTEDLQSRTQWLTASEALKLVILNTIPHKTFLTVSRLTVLEQFEAIKVRYRSKVSLKSALCGWFLQTTRQRVDYHTGLYRQVQLWPCSS